VFYSADPVTIDLEHGILMTKIGHPVQHDADPIAGNVMLRKALQDHYHSILDQIDLESPNSLRPQDDTLKNDWTLKLGDTKSEMQNLGDRGLTGELNDQKVAVDTNQEEEEQLERSHRNRDRIRDCQYLEQGNLDRNLQNLFDSRGQWITDYMAWLDEETDNDLREANEVHGLDMEYDERNMAERMLIAERMQMEMMLVDEIYGWEEKLRKYLENFVNLLVSEYGLDAVPRTQLEGRWRTRSWERLEKGRIAMEVRLLAAEMKVWKRVTDGDSEDLRNMQSECNSAIRDAWKLLLVPTPTASPPPPPRIRLNKRLENKTIFHTDSLTWSLLEGTWAYTAMKEDGRRRCDQGIQRMKSRLRQEVEGIEERLERGFERWHGFWSSQELVELTYSNSKWARFDVWWGDPFDAMLRALESRQNIIFIDITRGFPDHREMTRFLAATHMMASCTSISARTFGTKMPDGVQLPQNILSITHTELSEAHEDTLKQNRLQSRKTTIEVDGILQKGRVLSSVRWFTLRFFGPLSDYLTLRLIHCSSVPESYFTVNEGKYPIPHSDTLVVEEFKIWNSTLHKASELIFMSGSRNTLKFSPTNYKAYILRDIELLDTNRLPYEPADGGNEGEDSGPPTPGTLSLHIEL
jgi:hypothetical protein